MRRRLKNPNSPSKWSRKLFNDNAMLLRSPFYIDKLNRVVSILYGKRGRMLDIGFGAGNLQRELINKKSKLELYGLDFSGRAVTEARKNLKGVYIKNTALELPFKRDFFDFVTILDVLEHFNEADSRKVLKGAWKVLKSGGTIIISVPFYEDLKALNKSKTNFNAHVQVYTPGKLDSQIRIIGFEQLKISYIYAFKDFYVLKNIIVKIFPGLRKPSLMILYAQKK